MLKLTRKEGQRIYVGDEIEIFILGINGKRVCVGIEGPRDMRIDRAELRDGQRGAKNSSQRTGTSNSAPSNSHQQPVEDEEDAESC